VRQQPPKRGHVARRSTPFSLCFHPIFTLFEPHFHAIFEGFKRITSVDHSPTVIESRLEDFRLLPGPKFEVMAAEELLYTGESFECVLEKALLDSIDPGRSPQAISTPNLTPI